MMSNLNCEDHDKPLNSFGGTVPSGWTARMWLVAYLDGIMISWDSFEPMDVDPHGLSHHREETFPTICRFLVQKRNLQ